MRLREWLDANELTATAFAAQLGVSHSTVLRYADGSLFPSGPMISAIEQKTRGQVTAGDLHQAFAEYRGARKQRGAA